METEMAKLLAWPFTVNMEVEPASIMGAPENSEPAQYDDIEVPEDIAIAAARAILAAHAEEMDDIIRTMMSMTYYSIV